MEICLGMCHNVIKEKGMNRKKLRIYLNILLFVFFGVLFFLYISPLGWATYKKDFSRKYNNIFLGKGAIYKLGPVDRLFDKNKLSGEPAYFYLKTNRNFDSAKIKMKYKISDQVVQKNNFINLEFGVLLNEENWNYRFYPIYNNILNDLYCNWTKQVDNQAVFLQREDKFKGLTDYLNNKDFSSLLLYNYNLNNDFVLKDYQGDDNYKTTLPALRGSHVFYTYLKDENLKFDFSFSSLDRSNKNNLDLFVYLNDDVIFSKSFSAEEFLNNQIVDFSLDLADLPESVYKIEVRANDNFIINKTDVYLPKLVFLHRLNLYNTKNGFNVFSNKNNFRIKSLESLCLADVNINDSKFSVDRIFQQFNFNVDGRGINNIQSDSCGMLIENNGLFSFSTESFFNPLISSLASDVSVDEYNFVIAKYQPPTELNNYYISELKIDLRGAQRKKGEYRFIISAPFLKNEDNLQYLEIKDIEIVLSGKSLFDKIKEYLF